MERKKKNKEEEEEEKERKENRGKKGKGRKNKESVRVNVPGCRETRPSHRQNPYEVLHHSFTQKIFMSITYVLGTTLGTWETTVKKRKFLHPCRASNAQLQEAPLTLC